MFIFLSPLIKKPKKGDLLLNGSDIEIKGDCVRITGKVTGKSFNLFTRELASKFNMNLNKSNIKNLLAFEIEKSKYNQFYINEFNKIDIDSKNNLIKEYLDHIYPHQNIIDVFEPEFNINNLIKNIVIRLYKSMINDRKFDKFIILGDGSNIKIFNNDINQFEQDIINNKINILADYFRINQDFNIGWYIA